MLTLVVDSALNACQVALTRDGALLAHRSEAMSRGHAERLAPMAAEVFAQAGVAPAGVGRVGVVSGPGQFAGVRIGLAFALGLAAGAGCAVLGVTTLEAMAASHGGPWRRPRAAILDARRGEVYAALYRAPGDVVLAPFAAAIEVARARLAEAAEGLALDAVGDGAALAAPPGAAVELRADVDIAALAAFAAAADPRVYPPTPCYLRAPDATPTAASRFGPAP